MNTAKSCSTSYTPAYLTFGRELRTPDDVKHDIREIVEHDNFVNEVTPHLLMMADTLKRAREIQEMKEEQRKEYVDKRRRACPDYLPGDLVLVNTHVLSKSSQGFSSKLAPRRDGPYIILRRHGASSFEIANKGTNTPVGTYHASALVRYRTENPVVPEPTLPIRKRGRPRKQGTTKKATSTELPKPRGRPPTKARH